MFRSTILKLREQESTLTSNNGSFTTNLSKPIMIETGDQVQIKSAFLDTTIEQNITVEEPFTAVLTTCRYLTNYYLGSDVNPTNPFRGGGVVGQPPGNAVMQFNNDGTNPATPDMQKFWACQAKPGNNDNKLLINCFIKPIKSNRAYGSTRQLDYTFILNYRDPDYNGPGDAPFTRFSPPISIPKQRKNKKPEGFLLTTGFDFWVRIKPGSDLASNIRLAQPWTGQGIFNMQPPIFSNSSFDPVSSNDPYLELVTDKCEIPIAAGIYSPTEISTIITDGMSVLNRPNGDIGNDYSTGKFLVDSPFLSSTYQVYYKTFQNNLNEIPPEADDNQTILYVGENDSGLFSHWGRAADSTTDNLIGANNASLNFDENLSKLNFDVLHFPVQVPVNGANIPGIVYNPTNAGSPEGPILSYAGTGIVEFSPASFWSQLGFGPVNTVKPKVRTDSTTYDAGFYVEPSGNLAQLEPAFNTGTGTGRKAHLLTINTTDGVETTGQFPGMDLVVNSVAAAHGQPGNWMHPFLNTTGIASSVTTPIIGTTQFNGSSVNDGFYMINIGVNLPQEMIGSNEFGSTNSNTLQSIVGKFYTQGNFLQDEGSGSITYTHVGSPQLLSTLDVQVLNGDGTTPDNTDLGNNSTIFLEVVKAVKPPSPPPPPAGDKK